MLHIATPILGAGKSAARPFQQIPAGGTCCSSSAPDRWLRAGTHVLVMCAGARGAPILNAARILGLFFADAMPNQWRNSSGSATGPGGPADVLRIPCGVSTALADLPSEVELVVHVVVQDAASERAVQQALQEADGDAVWSHG